MSKGHSTALLDHGGVTLSGLSETVEGAGRHVVQSSTVWSGIALSVVSDLCVVEADWRAFELRADGTVFQTFDWLAKWQRHIGTPAHVVPAIVVGRDAGGAILFLLPLAVEPGRGVRRLTWLGAALCDYNGPLLAPEFLERVGTSQFPALWQAVLGILQRARLRFDFVDLPKMLENVGGQRNPFLELDVHPNPSGAYVAKLGEDWAAYYAAKRSGSTRKKERKQLKLLGERGAVRFVDVAEREAIVTSMETLIEQKTRSFARLGVKNNFARPGYREFYRDLTTDPVTRDLVHVSRLDVGDTIAAASLGLRRAGNYYLVLSSYQDGELARFGPGRAHLNELLRYTIGKRFKTFDFTIGDEPYKRDYSDVVLRPFDHLLAVTVRGQAVVAAMGVFRDTKRFIKQTPVLWRAYSKLRALKGALSGSAKRPDEPDGEAE